MIRARLVSGVLLPALFLFACEGEKTAPRPTELDAAGQGRGRDLFRRHGCSGCHGESGRGDGPAEARQRPRDFRDPAAFGRGAEVEAVVRTLRAGTPGSPMVSFDHLTEADLKLLARYVLFLRAGPRTDS